MICLTLCPNLEHWFPIRSLHHGAQLAASRLPSNLKYLSPWASLSRHSDSVHGLYLLNDAQMILLCTAGWEPYVLLSFRLSLEEY